MPFVIPNSAAGGPATIADGADVALGATTDATTANTLIGRIKNLLSRWPSALGQTTMAGSVPVVIASDQADTNSTVAAYAASRVIKASAGTLIGLSGYNSKTSAQFVQLHDAAALPADGAAPVVTFTVPASSNFSLSYNPRGRAFATGIVVCNSSTGPTKTIGSADCWFDAQFV